jgi:NAD(P)-dependent dehydrogenase (short-subunit alcohol dehydrogenase family)
MRITTRLLVPFLFAGCFLIPSASLARSGASDSEVSAHATNSQKAVLVTGASSGIGKKITELLSAKGVFVYAGARKASDLEALDAMDNVKSIRLDVTIQDDIDAAVDIISREGRGLHGLVNNAGVAILAPLIEVEESELDFLFDVNIYGPYRVTKAFAPLIIESKGRITTISSISGILSGTLFGPYSMSKHAMEAYSDSLAREMERFGVTVSVVEPGNYESKIGETLKKRMESRGIDLEGSAYQKEMQGMLDRVASGTPQKDPAEVAEAVYHALFDANPKMRYMVVPNERQAEITIRKAIQEMVQLNEGQPYTYDREALIAMLDEALQSSVPAPAAGPANQPGEMPEMTAEMQAEMEAWMKIAQPGPHHEHLAQLTGTWKGKVTMWMGPDTAPMTEVTTAEATWLMDGRYLKWHQTGNFGGMPYEGMAIEAHNNGEDRYESVWMDNFGTLLMYFTGSCSDDGTLREMRSSFADVVAGGTVEYRTEYRIVDENHFTYTAFMDKGDGEFKNVVIEYERH